MVDRTLGTDGVTVLARRVERLSFQHLTDLSDGRGLFEHALGSHPRREHGYCLDDVARAFVVVSSEPRPTPLMTQLSETYLRFIEDAIGADGAAHNRMSAAGVWTDEPEMGDWWGRAVAALGSGVRRAPDMAVRVRASRVFARAAVRRPLHVRTAAFAVLGAADLLHARPGSVAGRSVLHAGLTLLPRTAVAGWNWPEARMRYCDATVADALLAAAQVTADPRLATDALGFLGFLLESSTRGGHLSVTGTGGRGPDDTGPFFDQQPVEVAALADACARAYRHTLDPTWRTGVRMSWEWFEGANDVGVPMVDARTGAGFDGLEPGGRNENQGAESTISMLSTFQRARELRIVGDGR